MKRDSVGTPHVSLQGPSKRLRIGLRSLLISGTTVAGYTVLESAVEGGNSSLDAELSRAQRASLDSELYEEVS